MHALAQPTLRAHRPLRTRLRPVQSRIDLGFDPPIEVGRRHGGERRRIPFRWLCGTILTGLAGATLIGIAICASFDRAQFFAVQPEFAALASETPGDQLVNPRKGDRIIKPVDLVAVRHSFTTPVTVRAGAREVIRSLTFTRINTPLTMTELGFADQVPPFNPLRLVSQSAPDGTPPPDPGPAPDDAEVSFVTKDLSSFSGGLSAIALSTQEAAAQVSEYMRAAESGEASPALPPQLLLMRTSRLQAIDPAGGLAYARATGGLSSAPFSSIQVRMVPENVTFIPETASAAPEDERLVAVRHGEALDDVMRDAGVPSSQCVGLVQAFGLPKGESPVSEGERVKLQFIDGLGAWPGRRLARVSIYSNENLRAAAALDDDGHWAPVQEAPALAQPPSSQPADDDDRAMRLYDSLFETGLKAGMSRDQIAKLIGIFANDVDLQAPVAGGDSFDVLYRNGASPAAAGTILYAAITTHSQTLHYFWFRAPGDNGADYYDDSGAVRHKFLVRQPILRARMTSPFGARLHPILGYERMHTGVDWAAPIGTPIYAAGAGTVIKAGRESGYGNRVEIQHANGYVTTYSHMSGFARGIASGVHVSQGQVIGYLGMTGLATGPHVHYEVIVNGHFVDPLRVKLARSRELGGAILAQFRQDQERIERLLAASSEATTVAADAN